MSFSVEKLSIRKIPSVINNVLVKVRVNIPQEFANELYKERLRVNINRDKILSIALIFISSALSYMDIASTGKLLDNVDKVVFSIHMMLFLVSVLFLVFVYFGKKLLIENETFLMVLHSVLITVVLTLCSSISVCSRLFGQQPFSYVVAMFSIASMVLITPVESLLIYAFSFLVYTAGIIMLQYNISDYLFFVLLLLILALIIIRSNYMAFVRNFINNKVISRKNIELDQLNMITENALAKRSEELNQAIECEKLRTNFFANISHELRTPLTVIYSAEQMLDTIFKSSHIYEDKKDINKYMGIIRQNCYRLIRLISNLIDITKLDAGYLQADFINYNIVKVVEDITLSVAKYIEYENLSLTFDTEKEEIIVAFDPEKIERIILNLLSNAVKFTPKGGCIWVNVYEREDRVDICVKDTGIGIPNGMKDLIFERFVQVDKTNSRTREGSGIGLSLVKSLVDLHNGSISLVSEEGIGSEFIIGIPKKAVLLGETPKEYNLISEKQIINKINIEFSDIYS